MQLKDLKTSIPFSDLDNDKELCLEVQNCLVALGILGSADGIFDNSTINALVRFKRKYSLSGGNNIGATTAMWLLGASSAGKAVTPTPANQDGGEAKVRQLISKATAEHIFGTSIKNNELADLNRCLDTFEINRPQRKRHFMSQIAHESGGLRWLKELASGDDYEGREDLGNTQPGDGRKYKGAGAIQLTGRANYQSLSDFLKDPRVMEGCDYVSDNLPFTSAGFWWSNNDMNALCDRTDVTVRDVTLRVNGGTNGLDSRIEYYEKACEVI